MPQSKKTILIVEDEAILRELLEEKFLGEDFIVHVAVDGEEGLKKARAEHPDIILLDILMPKLDGFAVLNLLKKDTSTKRIPVILLSNLGQEDDIKEGLRSGAVDFLIKANFDLPAVVKKVQNYLRNSK